MPARYATKHVRNGLTRNVADMESTMANPVAWDQVQKKHEFTQRLKKTKDQLQKVTPPDVTSKEANALAARAKLVEEAIIKGAKMPSYREMWENHAGDTGKHISWEKTIKKHTVDPKGNLVPVDTRAGERSLIDEWKDLRRTLHKDAEEDDPDIANVEILRPRNAPIPLADTKSPRSYGLTPQARENYDTAFPDHVPTVVEKKLKRVVTDICGQPKKNGEPCGFLKGSCRWHKE